MFRLRPRAEELQSSGQIVEQIVRPTWYYWSASERAADHCGKLRPLREVKQTIKAGYRVLITT
jgi:excinuclease UvrABC helicase subunit UvrB